MCIGEVAEWFKAHRWKRCVQQCTAGSNPVFSASFVNRPKVPPRFHSIGVTRNPYL